MSGCRHRRAAACRARWRCRWIERALHREQPAALLVLLADADRLVGGAVQFLTDLHLDEGALSSPHHDEVETLREGLEAVRVQRPGAAHLPDAQAEIVRPHLVDAQFVEGKPHIQIALAHGGDADARTGAARGDDAVELVGAEIGENGVALVFLEPLLLRQRGIAEADIEPAGGMMKSSGVRMLTRSSRPSHDAGGFDGVLHRLQAHPRTGITRKRPGMQAVIDDLLHPCRVQDGDHHVHEMEFALVGVGGSFRRCGRRPSGR